MAKVIFEFDYQEDHEEICRIHAVRRMHIALDTIYGMTRSELKHGEEELSPNIVKLLEDIKNEASLIYELYE